MNKQNRRKFLKDSSKLGVAVIGVAAFGEHLWGSENLSKNSAKNVQDSSDKLAPDSKTHAKNSQNKEQTMNQVWYITGASGGLGFALAKFLLEKGEKVAATSRKIENLVAKFGEESENFLPLRLRFDKHLKGDIAQNFAAIKKQFSRLDNVVNNAGYGLLSFVEETSEKQLRAQFETNVFAPFFITQEALKIMRPQAIKEGANRENIKARIYNISSIGGFRVSAVSAPYCMSKFALSAFSEGLGLDLAEFGIAAVNVMPAGFRTEFAGKSMQLGENKIADYATAREAFIKRTSKYSGNQAGDPQKFAQMIFESSRAKKIPLHLFVGANAYKLAREKIKELENDMAQSESYAGVAMDFAEFKKSAF